MIPNDSGADPREDQSMEPVARFRRYLDEAEVPYHLIRHEHDIHARATAAHTDTPLDDFAKCVFLVVDDEPAIAVVPASREVALSKVRRGLDATSVRKAWETEIEALCPDCEVGAAPPFGPIYGIPVYVSHMIAEDEEITFNGGDHEHAFRMRFDDFERLIHPTVLRLCKHDGD